MCERGYHVFERESLLWWLGETLYECEVRGATITGGNKAVAESCRLLRPILGCNERTLRLFSARVAEDVLPIFEHAFPGDGRPREAIEVARRYALGEATEAARDAARATAAYAAADAVVCAAAATAAYTAADAAVCAAAATAVYAAAATAVYAAYAAARDAAVYAAAAAVARAAVYTKYTDWLWEMMEAPHA
jgi:hypothetical protein